MAPHQFPRNKQLPGNDVKQPATSENQQNVVTQSPVSPTLQDDTAHDTTKTQTSGNKKPDFSQLPDLIWIMIMSNLNQEDRLAVAETCSKLYKICWTESILWRSAVLCLKNPEQAGTATGLNRTDIDVLWFHSHQIKKLRIEMENAHGLMLSNETLRVLREAATTWPLTDLTIDCWRSIEIGKTVHDNEPVVSNVGDLIRKCLTSERLKGMERLSVERCFWAHGDEGLLILKALKISSFTNNLKYLDLGPIITSYEDFLSHTLLHVVDCVGRFRNLQELSIWIGYLSDVVIETLSTSMTSHFVTLKFTGPLTNDPESVTMWPQLLSSCPHLKVHLTISVNVSRAHLLAGFPPIVPVEEVTIYNFTGTSDYDNSLHLLQLLQAYFQTLTSLKWYCKSTTNLDTVLMDTVMLCPKLNALEFSGCISRECICKLICMQNLRSLGFVKESVVFSSTETVMQEWYTLELLKKCKSATKRQHTEHSATSSTDTTQ